MYTNKSKDKKLSKIILNEIIGMIEMSFISFFVITMIFTFVLRIATIKGESMEPTLHSDERVLTSIWYRKPKNGDIVIIDCQEAVVFSEDDTLEYREGLGKHIVKRVIAVAGQKIDIDFEKGIVFIDDIAIDEPYIAGLTHNDLGAFAKNYPFTVPENYVFVMGDNRPVSRDSRDKKIGLVSEESILGEVIFRISPIENFGWIR